MKRKKNNEKKTGGMRIVFLLGPTAFTVSIEIYVVIPPMFNVLIFADS